MKTLNPIYIFLLLSYMGFSQNDSIFVPLNLTAAYNNQTRSSSGKPGKNYWQNSADYKIKISFEPDTRKLSGDSEITYYNNSPDTLREIVMHNFTNIFKIGSARDRDIHPDDVSEGSEIEKLKFGDDFIIENSTETGRVNINPGNTFSTYNLPYPLPPNGKLELEVSWHYKLNKETHLRTGQTGKNGFMIAYFFPRIAVYDDLEGWNKTEYTGSAEFYNDFGNFEVQISVPENYIVWATGSLQNPKDVLQDKYYERYEQAINSENKIAIIDTTAIGENLTKKDENNIWVYKADNVQDFAFATAKDYQWHARRFNYGDNPGQNVVIHTAFNPSSKDFKKVNDFTKESIGYMSSEFPGIDFPYNTHTVFNGLGMMEYPMMANNISFEDLDRTRWLLHHETFHSYFPFLTGLNESKYAWLDEGMTMYGTNEFLREINSPLKDKIGFQNYKGKIGHDSDFPIFATSKYIKNPVYYNNSYPKTTSFLLVLRDYLGNEEFKNSIQEFVASWKGKHPTGIDFLLSIQNSTGKDLSWIINPWFFQHGYVDLAIEKIEENNKGYAISISNRGNYPAPVQLKLTFADGSHRELSKGMAMWENSNKYEIKIDRGKKIKRAELIDISLIDANETNNTYEIKK